MTRADRPLPAGLAARPLPLADAPAVVAVLTAVELAVLGRVLVEEADVLGVELEVSPVRPSSGD